MADRVAADTGADAGPDRDDDASARPSVDGRAAAAAALAVMLGGVPLPTDIVEAAVMTAPAGDPAGAETATPANGAPVLAPVPGAATAATASTASPVASAAPTTQPPVPDGPDTGTLAAGDQLGAVPTALGAAGASPTEDALPAAPADGTATPATPPAPAGAGAAATATVPDGGSTASSGQDGSQAGTTPGGSTAAQTAQTAQTAAPATATTAPSPTIAPTAAPAVAATTGPEGSLPTATPARGVALEHAVETVRLALRAAADRSIAHARITLSPRELGGIDVHLRQTADGLVARVVAQHAAAADLLLQAGAELRRSLESQGLTLLRLDVGASGEQGGRAAGEQRGFAAGNDSGGRSGSRNRASEDDLDATAAVDSSDPTDTTLLLPNGALVDVLA